MSDPSKPPEEKTTALFRRCEGQPVSNFDPIGRMMLLVMRGRNDSIVYHTTRWDISGGTGLASQLQSDATRVTSDHAFPSGSPHLAQGVADARTGQIRACRWRWH